MITNSLDQLTKGITVDGSGGISFKNLANTLSLPNESGTLATQAYVGIAKAWVNFNAIPLSGTYSQTGTVITVTMTAHGMSTGMIANLDFTSGTATDGTDFVVTVTGANTFTVVGKTSVTTSGNVTRNNYIRSAFNISSVTDNGVGNYSVNHTIGNTNYCAVVSTNGVIQNNSQANSLMGVEELNSSFVRVVALTPYVDFSIVNIQIFSI